MAEPGLEDALAAWDAKPLDERLRGLQDLVRDALRKGKSANDYGPMDWPAYGVLMATLGQARAALLNPPDLSRRYRVLALNTGKALFSHEDPDRAELFAARICGSAYVLDAHTGLVTFRNYHVGDREDRPRVQTLGRRETALGPGFSLRIRTPTYRALCWREVWQAFADAYPGRWAVECFPPADRLVDEANVYHLFMPDRPPEGLDICPRPAGPAPGEEEETPCPGR